MLVEAGAFSITHLNNQVLVTGTIAINEFKKYWPAIMVIQMRQRKAVKWRDDNNM